MNFIKEVRAFNESIAVNQLKPGHIAVWYALFNLSNKFQWQEWIPVPIMMLQLYTGLSEKAIRNDRNKLKQLGYIDFKTRGNSAPLYHINLLSGDESTGQSTGHLPGGVPDTLPHNINKTKLNKTNKTKGTPLTPQRGGVEQADPDAKIEPEKTKPKKKPKQDDPKFSEQAAKIIDHLNEKTGAHYKASTPKTKELIKARMNEGFTVDDFLKVIDNKVAEWGNDGKMRNYLRPVTLFAPSKFESYLNQQPKRSRWGDPNAWKQPERRYYYNT